MNEGRDVLGIWLRLRENSLFVENAQDRYAAHHVHVVALVKHAIPRVEQPLHYRHKRDGHRLLVVIGDRREQTDLKRAAHTGCDLGDESAARPF